MMRPPRLPRRRRAGGLLTLVGIGLLATTFVPTSSSASPARERAEISGTGDWSVNNQMNSWKSALYYSPQATDLSYLAKGDRDGRQIFARGDADFVVTGMPLLPDEQADLTDRKVTTISVPFSVASAAILMSGPFPTGLRTFTPDPVDPEGEGTFSQYTGKLRMPSTTLARILLDRGTNNWYDPDFLAANADLLPPGAGWAPVINPTLPVVRSDPSSTNFFMQQFIQKFAPDEFLLKVAESKLDAFQPTESWPFLSTGSRTGSVNTANLVAGWQNPKEGSTPQGGVLAATPISEALNQKADFPQTPLFIPELRNAAGEWVAPTSSSISIAIDQGDGAPLAALQNPIPGGYPLAWVNRLIAPANGLSIDRANAISTLIRYAVTAGQDASVALGEGRLSDKLVAEALAGADQLIAGNCVGADRKIVNAADGGPLWPTGVAMPVGTFKVCVAVEAGSSATTTTTTSTATSGASSTTDVAARVAGTSITGSGSSSSSGSLGSSGSGYSGASSSSGALGPADADPSYVDSGVAGPGAVPDVASDASGGPSISPQLAAATLPMKLPDTGRGALDRLSTMLLGAVFLVLGRGAVRRSKVVA